MLLVLDIILTIPSKSTTSYLSSEQMNPVQRRVTSSSSSSSSLPRRSETSHVPPAHMRPPIHPRQTQTTPNDPIDSAVSSLAAISRSSSYPSSLPLSSSSKETQQVSNVGVRSLPTGLTSPTLKAIRNPRELGLDEASAQAACLKIIRLELMAIAEKLIELIGATNRYCDYYYSTRFCQFDSLFIKLFLIFSRF